MQFDHNFVPYIGWTPGVARLGYVDIVRNAGIIRDDEEKLFTALQCADDLGAFALENTDDRTGNFVSDRAAAPGNVAPNQNTVPVQRSGGSAFRDNNLLEAWVIRFKETVALPVHTNNAGNEVGLAGLNISVPFIPNNAAILLQSAQGFLQGLLLVRVPAEALKQLRNVGGRVIFTG